MTDRPIPFTAPMIIALRSGIKTQTRRTLNPQPPKEADFLGSSFGMSRSVADGVKMYSLNDYERLPKHPSKWDLVGSVGVARDAGFPRTYDGRFAVGDRIYVREEYYQRGCWLPVLGEVTKGGRQKWAFVPADDVVRFDGPGVFRKGRHSADPATVAWHKRLGRFMPRAASRMTLIVTEVRVERLQDCSESDAIAEGIIEYEPTDEDPAEFAYVDGGDIWNNARSAYAALWNSINGPGAWEANPWVVAVTFTVEQRNIDQ